ncbi:ribbon-helix-helix domain-containing protein [Vibrio vulnificus]|nr:ribbon-helix-helix domain-containing protein [Vibrio vulnificus]
MSEQQATLKTKSRRLCDFYRTYLISKIPNKEAIPAPAERVDDYWRSLDKFIYLGAGNDIDFTNYVNELKDAGSKAIVPDDEIEWIRKANHRLAYWLWFNFRLTYLVDVGWTNEHTLPIDLSKDNAELVYTSLGLKLTPRTHDDRISAIIGFIDRVPVSLDKKRAVLKLLDDQSNRIFNSNFRWVKEDNEQQCQWVWSYIKTTQDALPHFLAPPITAKELHDASIAVFDIWQASDAEKELFIYKMKKAWGQKKHRKKMEGQNKKGYSFTMSEDIKSALDRLCKHTGQSKNQIVEQLIKEKIAAIEGTI